MTDEALIVKINRIINESNKRPQLDFFFRANPIVNEYVATLTDSNNEKLIEFAKGDYKTKKEFVEAFNKVKV